MGALLGLGLGTGLLLIAAAITSPPSPSREARWRRDLQDLLTQAGLHGVSASGFVTSCCASAATVFLLALGFSGSPAIACCFAVMGGGGPLAIARSRARRRRAALRAVWPEVVDHLGSGIRAGLSLAESVAQLGERGPSQLRSAFREFAEDYRASGRFTDCLDALKARLADPVADRIIEALRLTREVGGSDLGTLLRTLSGFLRQDLQTRGELEARQSWTVNAARLAVAAPWVVLALLATRPEAAAFNTPAGALVLLTGGGCSLIAYRVMLRIGRLPEEARVLR